MFRVVLYLIIGYTAFACEDRAATIEKLKQCQNVLVGGKSCNYLTFVNYCLDDLRKLEVCGEFIKEEEYKLADMVACETSTTPGMVTVKTTSRAKRTTTRRYTTTITTKIPSTSSSTTSPSTTSRVSSWSAESSTLSTASTGNGSSSIADPGTTVSPVTAITTSVTSIVKTDTITLSSSTSTQSAIFENVDFNRNSPFKTRSAIRQMVVCATDYSWQFRSCDSLRAFIVCSTSVLSDVKDSLLAESLLTMFYSNIPEDDIQRCRDERLLVLNSWKSFNHFDGFVKLFINDLL